MSNEQISRLQSAITALEGQEHEVVDLLRHLQQEGDALLAVIQRQEATLKALQATAAAGREVLAGAVRLGGLEALDGAVRLQEGTVSVAVSEAEAATAPFLPAAPEQEQPAATAAGVPAVFGGEGVPYEPR